MPAVLSDTKNVKIGVCRATYGGNDLGYTMGGCEVIVATQTHKVEVDQFGKTSIAEVLMGRTCMVKVPMAETTIQKMSLIMPGSTVTAVAGPPATNKISVTSAVGINLLDTATELRLHPLALIDTDLSEDFVVPLAATAGALTFAYKLENERIFNVEFTGFPDPVTKVLYTFGD